MMGRIYKQDKPETLLKNNDIMRLLIDRCPDPLELTDIVISSRVIRWQFGEAGGGQFVLGDSDFPDEYFAIMYFKSAMKVANAYDDTMMSILFPPANKESEE